VHLAGHKNEVADALSRLDLDTSSFLSAHESAMAGIFAAEDIAPVTYPLQLKRITEFQQQDKESLQKIFFWGQKNAKVNLL